MLNINPSTIDHLIPKDLTAILPSKQLYSECQHDKSQQSQCIEAQVSKLIKLLEGPKCSDQPKNQNKFFKVDEVKEEVEKKEVCLKNSSFIKGKDENIDYLNRTDERISKI